jgi:hypothetical protein
LFLAGPYHIIATTGTNNSSEEKETMLSRVAIWVYLVSLLLLQN